MNQTPRTSASPLQTIRRNAISLLTSGQVDKGIALLEEAAAKAPASGELQNDLGTANWQAGRPEKAEAHYKQALKLAPQNAFVLNSYGAFLLEQLRLPEAEDLLSRALKSDPANAEILNNMGLLLYRRGDMAGAEKLFIDAIRRNPKWANPHANIGNVLRDTKRLPLAEKAYQQAVTLNPRHAQAWHDLGTIYASRTNHAEAVAAYQRAVTLYPQMEHAWSALLDLLEKTNRLDEAARTIDKAKQFFPDSPDIAISAAKLLRRAGKTDEAFAAMEAFAPRLRPDVARNAAFFYELGQLYDRRDNAAKAFEAFRKANACKTSIPAAKALHTSIYTEITGRILREFTPGLENGPLPAGDEPAPVFLVGFPRSGTTLLDQIMTSHPGVSVAEENPAVDKMIHHLVRSYGTAGAKDHPLSDGCYPAGLSRLTAEDIAIMREKFWAEHGGRPQQGVFVDKLPLNILHAGIIRRVFPQAKFILALRHPCDSVLSCYMQDFHLNSAMARFLDLDDSAKFYDEAFTVWEHYNKVMKLDVHTIRYEDVVADFRPTVAKLLEFLNVPWNDAVLEYDKTAQKKGLINTPSYHQVTQKIYTRASGRWLKYREQLKPVLDILAPHAARYGYAMTERDEA